MTETVLRGVLLMSCMSCKCCKRKIGGGGGLLSGGSSKSRTWLSYSGYCVSDVKVVK